MRRSWRRFTRILSLNSASQGTEHAATPPRLINHLRRSRLDNRYSPFLTSLHSSALPSSPPPPPPSPAFSPPLPPPCQTHGL